MFILQRNVPKPPVQRKGAGQPRKYPIDKLEIGEMFFVPEGNIRHLGSHMAFEGRKIGRKLSLRQMTMRLEGKLWVVADPGSKGAVEGVGVWRDA